MVLQRWVSILLALGKHIIINISIYHNREKEYTSPIYIQSYKIALPFLQEEQTSHQFPILLLSPRQKPPNPQICQKQRKTSFSRRFFQKTASYNPTILQFYFIIIYSLCVCIYISAYYVVFCSFVIFVGL
nr:MAG TPA: hypothetical protein [Caudoviricetes sp.]